MCVSVGRLAHCVGSVAGVGKDQVEGGRADDHVIERGASLTDNRSQGFTLSGVRRI
jgi:hypothetical protein